MLRENTEYCPKILKKLEKIKEHSTNYNCEWSGGDKYKVTTGTSSFIVDKNERTCSCRRWELSGIPCAHAVCAIWYHNEDPMLYLDVCYKVRIFLEIYKY